MAKDDSHFRLRIPADLKVKIEASAADSHRSINAEIVALLEAALAATYDIETVGRLVDDHEKQLKELWIHIETLLAYALHAREDPVKGTQT